jgi:hypothetical protein
MAMNIERGKNRTRGEGDRRWVYAMRERWEARVNQKPFMQQLMAGKLPLTTLQIFRNWGAHHRDQHADRLHLSQEHHFSK